MSELQNNKRKRKKKYECGTVDSSLCKKLSVVNIFINEKQRIHI